VPVEDGYTSIADINSDHQVELPQEVFRILLSLYDVAWQYVSGRIHCGTRAQEYFERWHIELVIGSVVLENRKYMFYTSTEYRMIFSSSIVQWFVAWNHS
jgi:hypothetical protein